MPKGTRKNWNQDYYKVAGTEIGSRDQAKHYKDMLGHQKTELRENLPAKGMAARPGYRQGGEEVKTGKTTVHMQQPKQQQARQQGDQAAKRTQARKPERESAPPVRAPRAEAQPAALVREIRQERPRHGKKRRSAKKRHEVGVIQELRANPQESPQEAAEKLRTQEKPLAEVVDVRQAARRKSAAGPAPSQMPDALPLRTQKRVEELAHRAYETGRMVYDFARELVTAPATVLRVLRALRQREA